MDFQARSLFQDELLQGSEQQRADLSGKEFLGCTFRNMKLQESVWRGARLEDCVFEDCDLTRMDPARMALLGVLFRRSKLMGIDWTALTPNPSVTFEECDLRYASFVGLNLRRCAIRGCRAIEANFLDCDLSDSDFTGTSLVGANLEGSEVTRANLAGAEGAFVSPSKNRVKDVYISVASAVELARSFGMRVEGHDQPLSARTTVGRQRKSPR